MSQSYKFHRLCPNGVMHNVVAADRAMILSEMKNGSVFETDSGYRVVKPYGSAEFVDSSAAAEFIMHNERKSKVMHNEKPKKTRKKRVKKVKVADPADFGFYL